METWIGFRVDDLNGAVIGELEQVVVDESERPAWLLVNESGSSRGRRFAIPAVDAVNCGDRVWSPHLRNVIRSTAELAADRDPDADVRLRAHYFSGS